MTKVKKTGVIESIFTHGIYPAYCHAITGEIFGYNKDWNTHANFRSIDREKLIDKLDNGGELTKKEEDKLLIPGLVQIKNNHWFEETFEVIE